MVVDADHPVIARILKGQVAWTLAEDFAPGEDPGALVAGGWVTPWRLPLATAYTLTPWAARELGVKVVERGAGEEPRWESAWTIPPQVTIARHGRMARLDRPELVVDPREGPPAEAMRRERGPLRDADGNPVLVMGTQVQIDGRLIKLS